MKYLLKFTITMYLITGCFAGLLAQTSSVGPYISLAAFNNDSVLYLAYNFERHKQNYIGKPLNVLLDKLEIKVLSSTLGSLQYNKKVTPFIYLKFYDNDESFARVNERRRFFDLIIYWGETVLYNEGFHADSLDNYNWGANQLAFYGSKIIKNIKLYNSNRCEILGNGSKHCPICDQSSSKYNALACAQSYCSPTSANYDSAVCDQSFCDPSSPVYNSLVCEIIQDNTIIADTSVVAYYTFNNELGHSVHGNPITLQDGAELSDGKLVLGGMYYDDDDNMFFPHATAANSPSLNPQNITVAARIKPQEFYGCGADAIVCKPYTSHTPPYYQYLLCMCGTYCGSNGHRFSFSCSINGQSQGVASPAAQWQPDQWYTVVGVYDGSNIKLFVNGALIASKPMTGNIDSYNTDLFIGKHGNVDYSIPAGYEWLKIYNRGLSDAEVSVLEGN